MRTDCFVHSSPKAVGCRWSWRSWWFATLCGASAAVATPQVIAAPSSLDNATATAGAHCIGLHGVDRDFVGPLPYGLSLSCDLSGSAPQGPYGTATWQAVAHVNAGLGSKASGIGVVDVQASANAVNDNAEAEAGAGGLIEYTLQITASANAPFLPDSVPIRFVAHGEVHATGSGVSYRASFWAFADLAVPGFPKAQFSIPDRDIYNFNQYDEAFSDAVTLQVPLGQIVSGRVNGGCTVNTLGAVQTVPVILPLRSDAECGMAVDPAITLDQQAFDAAYGSNSFALADYYALNFSPNVPVPEPATALLWLTGLAVVGRCKARRCVG
jgi:hypothetical protein